MARARSPEASTASTRAGRWSLVARWATAEEPKRSPASRRSTSSPERWLSALESEVSPEERSPAGTHAMRAMSPCSPEETTSRSGGVFPSLHQTHSPFFLAPHLFHYLILWEMGRL